MNANDIIEVFEHCMVYSSCSVDCPYFGNDDCFTESMKNILALAKRQKAEIEMLNKTIESLQAEVREINRYFDDKVAEAIKEFAKRLKETKIKPEFPWDDFYDFYVTAIAIDTLVKEMTEEDNDTIL